MILLSRVLIEYDKRLYWVSFLGLAAPVAPHVADPLPTKRKKMPSPSEVEGKHHRYQEKENIASRSSKRLIISADFPISQSLRTSRLSSETRRHCQHRQHSPVSSHIYAAELLWPLELATR